MCHCMSGAETFVQEFAGALKIVKVEADPCPSLVEKYKVRQPLACSNVK